ncbi:Similar to NCBP3: Nuclear cap-binding protein subunit 3 (Gallus gallus) [Cotesia congregata]|uniref:Nuclear cap-binding protein subunit 3 n=1 Tax=Cotesia congregata TaxID=51543 RepID=A0A8J2HCD5_COTCN|nr:Similar to NCBP3: Nuclear cap-binding protein subunit 3 (Gallus gallus) [Cotesia congregata]
MAEVSGPMDTDSYIEASDDVNTDLDTLIQKRNLLANNLTVQPKYENKSGAFTTGIDIFSKEEQQKLEERAKRFGMKENARQLDVEDEEELYESMGVSESDESAKYTRFNTLHMRGTDNMSTQDVFDYFKDYAPASIEWINDISCNVVWLDKISAARALIGLSKRITSKEPAKEEDDAMEGLEKKPAVSIKDIDFPLPPGIWRKGVECAKSKTVLLRFATTSDKKPANAEKMSEYYKKHGNPNYGGIKGILTQSRKRKYRDVNWQEEEKEALKEGFKNPWGSLSEAWGSNDPVEVYQRERPLVERTGIKERLGVRAKEQVIEGTEREGKVKSKVMNINVVQTVEDKSEDSASQSDSDSDDGWNKRNKILRMRMHADDEEEKVQKKRLTQMKLKMQDKVQGTDLRSRLGRGKPAVYHEPIRVTVTNLEYGKNLHLEEEEEEGEEQEEEVEEVEENEEEEEEEDKEEGEWEDEEPVQEPEESDSDSSDISEKEVQGPKGSVIKVITRPKPRVASTVWARLNNEEKNSSERNEVKSVIKADLRSRLGFHNRGRSPLRIEVKNDKYAEESDSE